MIAIFPPPFNTVSFGSASSSVCEAEDADAEIIDVGRMLSSYDTPAEPTYFHFTISSDASRITMAMFSNVAVYQENSLLVTNSGSWAGSSEITASESFYFVALY